MTETNPAGTVGIESEEQRRRKCLTELAAEHCGTFMGIEIWKSSWVPDGIALLCDTDAGAFIGAIENTKAEAAAFSPAALKAAVVESVQRDQPFLVSDIFGVINLPGTLTARRRMAIQEEIAGLARTTRRRELAKAVAPAVAAAWPADDPLRADGIAQECWCIADAFERWERKQLPPKA